MTVDSRYSSAGSISPSPRAGPEAFPVFSVLSRVVNNRAKYAAGERSVFCSVIVASKAIKRLAGAFWCARAEVL